ncbi:MAG: outer membrane protein assembly factor BamA [Chlamydiia bacterium]
MSGKRRKRLWAALFMGLCATPCLLTAETFDSYASAMVTQADDLERAPIHSIQILPALPDPDQAVDARILKAKLRTREGDLFSQSAFDADLKMLAEQYDQVDPQLRSTPNGLEITLRITPRPTIREIEFVGNGGLGTRRLQRALGLTLQAPLNRKELIQGLQKIRQEYIKKGYFEARVEPTVERLPDENAVKIVIHVNEGRAGRVDEIRFVNMTDAEESAALEKLNLKEWFFLTSWATEDGTYRQDIAEHDRLQVLNILQNVGYADARVQLKVTEIPNKKRITVEFIADKGPLYTFGELSFEGNTLFTNQDLWNCFNMRPGEPYSPERVRDTVQAMKDLYGSKGYIEADVQFAAELEQDAPIYRMQFKIKEGEQFKVGMVRIFGNEWTQSRIILRECVLIPGTIFDSRRLQATERRLENIGYFKSVNVYAVKASTQSGLGDNFRDVYIEVEEQNTGSFNLSAGYGTSEGITAGAEFAERNFNLAGLGHLRSEGLSALRGGGEYLHAKISWGTKQSVLGLNWLDPYFRDTLWRVGLDLTRTSGNLQSEDFETVTDGIVARASYPLNPYFALTARYRLVREYTDIEVDGITTRMPGASGTVSAFSLSLGLDSTNKPFDPTTGLRSELRGEIAGLGGTAQFATVSFLNTLYTTVLPVGTIRYRLDFNFMKPFGKTPNVLFIPYNERFFLGGDQSVRGYRPFVLGPWIGYQKPLGGMSSGLASVEWNWRFYNEWRLFVFMDAGSVSAEPWHLDWPWQASYGVGMTIPIFGQAPFTIGYGIPVNPTREGEQKRLFFSMGSTF